MIFVGSLLILLKQRNSRSAHTFSAVHAHVIRLKLNEWQAIFAVKFEIQLGVKETLLCTKHKLEVLWNRRRAVLLGEERRGEGEGRGGNCHIKGKEFKIYLISQSLSPPKRFAVSMLRLVITQGEYRESETETGKKEGEILIEVTDWLPTRMNLRGKVHTEGATLHAKSFVALSELVVQCLGICEVALITFAAKATFAFTPLCWYLSRCTSLCS